MIDHGGVCRQQIIEVGPFPQLVDFHLPKIPHSVDLRNLGPNTLFVSLDEGGSYFDVCVGTSWDIKAEIRHLYLRTRVGKTRAVLIPIT